METYIVTAKTVEEAIAAANREYAKNGKEISYEILEMPKKGFLGIGAKDAKLKITVTESASSQIGSELSSIVADLRGMKIQTNRGGSEREERPRNSQKNQNNQNSQKKQQNQNPQKKAQNPQNPQNQQNQQNQQKAEKPAQNQKQSAGAAEAVSGGVNQGAQKAGKPQKPQNQQNQGQNQQKTEKPARDKSDRPERPERSDRPERSENKPQQNAAEKAERPERAERSERSERAKPQNQSEKPRAERPEKPARAERGQTASANANSGAKQQSAPAAVQNEQPVKAKPEAPSDSEKPAVEVTARQGSSLRNQAKPPRRAPQPKKQPNDDVSGAEAIIASPVGLSDFTSENAGMQSFGGENRSAGGRMSNDIRRKQRPAAKQTQAQTPQTAPTAQTQPENTEKPEAKKPGFEPERIETVESFGEAFEAFEADNESAADIQSEAQDRQKVGVTQAEMDYALSFANTLLKNMQIDAVAKSVPCPEGEEYVIEGDANVYPKIDVEGEGTGILIGHHGETLDAVQYLVNLAALRQSKQKGGDYVRIVVDIENYRAKREETLRALARRMAARAVKYKRNVFLEPMNAYERRIIHSELHDYPNVSTHSVGADKNRKIIITYEGPDKVSAPRRDREKNASGENGGSAGSSRRTDRRPKKIQKMPIDKLPDFLAAGMASDEPAESPEFED